MINKLRGIQTGFLILLLYLVSNISLAQSDLSSDQWREDLRLLEEKMPKFHKNIYHTMTQQEFHDAVDKLYDDIPHLSRHEIIVRIAEIVALVRDGHSVIRKFVPDQGVGFRAYPIGLYSFSDGIFIQATHQDLKEYIGARIVKIGNDDINEAIKKVNPIIFHDNEMGIKGRMPFNLVSPEILHAVGVIDDMENVQYIVEKNGQRHVLELQPIKENRPRIGLSFFNHQDWVDAKDLGSNPPPLWARHIDKNYWYKYDIVQKSMYVQFNECYNSGDQTIEEFFNEVFSVVDTNEIDRFILDIRLNGGGSSNLNRPIILGILKRQKINERGKLFVVIGRRTFSAAQILVNELAQYSEAIFVGEPTGSKIHFYSDAAYIDLPNSKLKVGMSTIWWQTLNPNDNRRWTAPDLSAELSSDDYLNGRDPVMEAILSYSPKAPLIKLMSEAIATAGIHAAVKIYDEYKHDKTHKYKSTEGLMNRLGYQLMAEENKAAAIIIFQLNTKDYPLSSNAWDSYAEAQMNSNNIDLAIKYYNKSIELNPENRNAENMIRNMMENKDVE